MRERIIQELDNIEREHDVRVLFACESGSRAWGFESQNSDWDVRFVYVNRLGWYLSVEAHRDVIEEMLPDDLDLAGWNLRKALGLLRKSNPSLLEWLNSPIVYRADDTFVEGLKALAREYWSEASLFKHYLSMARTNTEKHLQSESISRKKYLYVLRPLLACRWILREKTMPPIEFEKLRAAADLDPALNAAIDQLLDDKRTGNELGAGPPVQELSGFVASELAKMESVQLGQIGHKDLAKLDAFFRSWIL
jgi:predicted nucleotidyltransferase